MTRKYLISLFLLLFTISFASFAQADLSKLSAGKLKKTGATLYAKGDVFGAIRHYEAFLKKKEDPAVMFLLADAYRTARNYPLAQFWFNKAYKANPKKNAKALYYYATMLKTASQYEDAAAQFKIFKKEYAGFKDSPVYLKLVKNQLASIDSSIKAQANPRQVRVTNMGNNINSPMNEYMPIYLSQTSFIYATRVFDTLNFTPQMLVPTFSTAVKYGINWLNNGDWEFKPDGETVNINHGAFSPDFQRFYFTQCSRDKKNIERCELYSSKNVFGAWQKPEKLPDFINLKGSSITQVTVGNESKKGDEVLYFVTNRPGGQGGLDIWYTIFMPKSNAWREAKNCGNKINTPADEVTPYYDVTARALYFSSNGLPGQGEMDIFKTNGELGKWTPAENMGSPINTPFDDYYFSTSPDSKEGLFASNRPGSQSAGWEGCCDDIYHVNFENVFDIPLVGRVYEVEDRDIFNIIRQNFEADDATEEIRFLPNSPVSLFIGNSNEKVFIASTKTDANGRFEFVVEPNRNYVLQFENARTGTALMPLSTQGVETPDTIFLKDYGINYISREKLFVSKNIYYEFGKYKLTPEQRQVVDTSIVALLRTAPDIVIELRSHTDNIGGEDFNMKLSQRRANEIIKYVIAQGISPSRISGKGFGFSVPIAPNNRPDGSDFPEGRAKNRRTEIRVIGTVSGAPSGGDGYDDEN
ncbi:MAG: OmpA family protein [Bacteroidales bacterium]|jgi:outer membrane protein OmpA-like peptidoglycan-associated protein|nr:OmpA family protein [Bacteroidales bacterium]